VHGSPTVCPPRHTRGRRALGWGRPWSSPWPCRELLSLVVPSLSACIVLSGLYPYKVDYWFESPQHSRTWMMACSPHPNVELWTSQYYDDNYMDGDDYFVVMVYVNQYCFDTFACLDSNANLTMFWTRVISTSANSEISFEESFGYKPFVCLKHEPNV
jgi:hypothetical protein